MKVAAFSDCHCGHKFLRIPEGVDLIAVAGDWTNFGSQAEAEDFLVWLANQPSTHKVVIPGNHDFIVEKAYGLIRKICEDLGIHLLVDEIIELDGKLIFGSPRTPWYGDYAYVYEPFEADYIWDAVIPQIPLDLLITHGPPQGILDRIPGSRETGKPARNAGCPHLGMKVRQVRPKVHIFGHIHAGHGEHEDEHTRYYNVAVMHHKLGVIYQPAIFEI